ncbi:MAG: hypothetical protein VX189_01455, partial [Planctomycetota bacterium]|nr:hypothetical protein [Planctomycetota bacterium]
VGARGNVMARIAIGRYLWKKSVWVALGLPRCCKMRRLLWLIRLEYQGWYFEKTRRRSCGILEWF